MADSAETPARRRLLDTAGRLFYAEGIHAVGIDRIIAEAGVAKATFYKHFPSKDELVRAYVEEQDRLGRLAADQTADQPPSDRVVTLLEGYVAASGKPGYRGCPFINAAAEYPDPAGPVRQAIDEHRRWLRGLLRDLLRAADHPTPDQTADVLVVLADGLLVGGELDGHRRLSAIVHDTVTTFLAMPRAG
jgi:AcrR family transcriptional regulator